MQARRGLAAQRHAPGGSARTPPDALSYPSLGALGGSTLVWFLEAFLALALAVFHVRFAVRAGVGPLRDTLEADLAVAHAFLHSA